MDTRCGRYASVVDVLFALSEQFPPKLSGVAINRKNAIVEGVESCLDRSLDR
jgi:hypothetical protein